MKYLITKAVIHYDEGIGNKNLFLMSNNNKIEISKECTFEQILNQLEDENN